jgi:hypothetical protein
MLQKKRDPITRGKSLQPLETRQEVLKDCVFRAGGVSDLAELKRQSS